MVTVYLQGLHQEYVICTFLSNKFMFLAQKYVIILPLSTEQWAAAKKALS